MFDCHKIKKCITVRFCFMFPAASAYSLQFTSCSSLIFLSFVCVDRMISADMFK